MENLKAIRINFDNGGGIQLWSDDYAHSYDDGKQVAEDVLAIFSGAIPGSEWDGNEPELLEALLGGETERFASNVTYSLDEIHDLLNNSGIEIEDGEVFIPSKRRSQNGLVSGYSEREFFKALVA